MESHLLLELSVTPASKPGQGGQPGAGSARWSRVVADTVRQGSERSLRLRLDLAGEGCTRQSEDRDNLQCQHTGTRGSCGAAHLRHVGACVLHRPSQRPCGVLEKLLAAG